MLDLLQKVRLGAIALSLCAASFTAPVYAASPMGTGATVVPPAGFIGFCVKYRQECKPVAAEPAIVPLTDERFRELEQVQEKVNAAIEPREDSVHAWDYSTDGTGDCNKYALTKRRELIALGWPRDTLLLTTALTERGEGHLVLVARTSGGDLVLDNRVARVVDWSRLPYRWLSRQSQFNPAIWVSVAAQPEPTASVTAATTQVAAR